MDTKKSDKENREHPKPDRPGHDHFPNKNEQADSQNKLDENDLKGKKVDAFPDIEKDKPIDQSKQ